MMVYQLSGMDAISISLLGLSPFFHNFDYCELISHFCVGWKNKYSERSFEVLPNLESNISLSGSSSFPFQP
jgi:hypothetical protein